MRARPLAWLLAGTCLAPTVASAAPGFTTACPDALRKSQLDELTAVLRAVDDGCTLDHIDTAGPRTEIAWRHDDTQHTALLAPRGCLVTPTHEGPGLAAHLPTPFPCPGARTALEQFITADHSLAPLLQDGWHPDEPTLAEPRHVVTALALLALLLLIPLTVRRLRSFTRADAPWLALATSLFLVALLARLSVAPAPANWYGAFLPHTGPGDLRFGAGAAVVQSLFRAITPWSLPTAFQLFITVGALLVPLTILLARRLEASLFAAACTGILAALAPLPVRLSASSSEHTIAAFFALAAWLTWQRTTVDSSLTPRLLTFTLAALAALTRVDVLPQLALIPLWSLLIHREHTLPLHRRLLDAAAYSLTLAATATHAWLDIVRPSHHPGPTLHAITTTTDHLLSQFWTVAVTPPHWLPAPLIILPALGLLTAALQRRWRFLLAAFTSLALTFIPLGRNLEHDGLTGARYFILLTPLLALLTLPLFTWLRPRLSRLFAALFLILLAFTTAWTAQPAYHHTTTFQAEYHFLKTELADPHLADCTVWFVPPRQPVHEPDLDCCLFPDRSPLALLPVRFAAVHPGRDPDDTTGCQLYYEGAVCSLDPALTADTPQTASRILAACDRLRRRPAHEVARTTAPLATITPRTSTPPTITLKIRGHDI